MTFDASITAPQVVPSERELAEQVTRCPLMVAARALVESTPPKGRRVTPAGALSPAEVPEAAAALGLTAKLPVRRAADLPLLHHGWLMAVAAGLLTVSAGRATPNLDPAEIDDAGLLAGWQAGLERIYTDLSGNKYPQTLKGLVLLTLEALPDSTTGKNSPTDAHRLWLQVDYALRQEDWLRGSVEMRRAYPWLVANPKGSDWKLFGLLADAGLVQGTAPKPEVTPLGRWFVSQLRAQAPVEASPDWSATAVLAHLVAAGPDADLWRLSTHWRWQRETEEVIGQLLSAAVGTDATTRSAAVRLTAQYGEAALPTWTTLLDTDDLGPHARKELHWWDQGPGLRAGDRWWLGVEWAADSLVSVGPDEALSLLADAAAALADAAAEASGSVAADLAVDDDTGPDFSALTVRRAPVSAPDLIAAVPGSGHPQATQLTEALTEFLASGAPRSIEHHLQVTVRLTNWRPATWRRVLLPATESLGTLSWVISVLFGWGGDHLHHFQVGRRYYSDPNFPLDDADDEDDGRLSRLFAAGERKLTYTYDLGARWTHDIVLDKLVPTTVGQPAIRCLAFAGDSPLEYPMLLDEEDDSPIADPIVTRPFDLAKVNTALASGVYEVPDE